MKVIQNNKWKIVLLVPFMFGVCVATAQNSSTTATTTAVPFLLIGPDARSGGLGDAGGATAPDVNSQAWNAAKYAFCEDRGGIGVSYSPWLRSAGVDDINLAYLAGYYKLDERNSIAGSFRYFSMGQLIYTDNNGNHINSFNPNEFAVDLSYTRKFGENFAMAMTARYIYSNLGSGAVEGVSYSTTNAVAVDFGAFYNKELNDQLTLRSGLGISNMGPKITYGLSEMNLPTNLRISEGLGYKLDDMNVFNFSMDINKMLVQAVQYNSDGTIVNLGMKGFGMGTGLEYVYNDLLFLRGGYFFETQHAGSRNYATVGLGIKYNDIAFDTSYSIADKKSNPMANTLKFTLLMNFGTNTYW